MDGFKTKWLTVSKGTDEELSGDFDYAGVEDFAQFLETISEDDFHLIRENKADVVALVDDLRHGAKEDDRVVFIARDADDRKVGYIALNNATTLAPELQMEIREECRGQGYGFELLTGLLEHWTVTGEFQHFIYHVQVRNRASIRLVEKIGGILQPPKSQVEALLLRTYHITTLGGKKMRVLMRDKDDQTLVALEVTEAVYDPEKQMLYLYNTDTGYQVERVVGVNADSIFRDMYSNGMTDPTDYPACEID